MSTTHKATIVGGGLAGLAVANALAAVGIETEIFEQASTLAEIGAGINISPQGVKALRAIGVGERAESCANVSRGIYTRDMHTGEPLGYRDTRNASQHYGAPFLTFHRADLIGALAGGLDPASIHLGHRLVALEERGGGIDLAFASGATCHADLLIGADGIHSVVRRTLYGEDHPAYTGQMVWRVLIKGSDVAPEILEPSGHIRWMGPGRHFYGYYLRGRDVVNIVTQEDTEKWVEEGWSTAGDPDEMRASFPNPEPRLKALMDVATTCSKWGLFLRPPTESWGRGRIQLVGDAAHAMLPNAGQGACQSFEDACTLARWLVAEPDAATAFANFRRVRIPRVHAVQRRSAANARLYHMHDRTAQKQVFGAREYGNQSMEWIYAYDPVAGWDKEPVLPSFEG